jgi:hypothetical protein
VSQLASTRVITARAGRRLDARPRHRHARRTRSRPSTRSRAAGSPVAGCVAPAARDGTRAFARTAASPQLAVLPGNVTCFASFRVGDLTAARSCRRMVAPVASLPDGMRSFLTKAWLEVTSKRPFLDSVTLLPTFPPPAIDLRPIYPARGCVGDVLEFKPGRHRRSTGPRISRRALSGR